MMGGVIWIAFGVIVAAALSPVLWYLARRWRRGAASFATGSVVGDAGIGSYITQLRTGRGDDGGDGDGGSANDGDVSGGDGGSDGGSDGGGE
jgi:hypothetical protein